MELNSKEANRLHTFRNSCLIQPRHGLGGSTNLAVLRRFWETSLPVLDEYPWDGGFDGDATFFARVVSNVDTCVVLLCDHGG
jgi:hypothetical protein